MEMNISLLCIEITSRDVPLKKLFSQFQGKLNKFTKGRDHPFHFGSKEHHIIGIISHIGAQLGVADGIALYHSIKYEKKSYLYLRELIKY